MDTQKLNTTDKKSLKKTDSVDKIAKPMTKNRMFWSRVLAGLQRLGKSLMFPIAVLPFAALLNRFGQLSVDLSHFSSTGDKNVAYWFGFILQQPGAIVFNNLPIIFAIGTGFGLAKDNRGEAALVAGISYLAVSAFLAQGGIAELLYSNVLTFDTFKQVDVSISGTYIDEIFKAGGMDKFLGQWHQNTQNIWVDAKGVEAADWLKSLLNNKTFAVNSWADFIIVNKADSIVAGNIYNLNFSTASDPLSQLFYVQNWTPMAKGAANLDKNGLAAGSGTYILDIGALGGIVCGCTSAWAYNKFKGIQLPQALSFFGGRRFVPMMIMVLSWPIALSFAIIWPWFQFGLVKFGSLLSSSDAWAVPGAFLYALINRIIQPFGLHHIINTFLWFQMPINGHIVNSVDGLIQLDPGALKEFGINVEGKSWADMAVELAGSDKFKSFVTDFVYSMPKVISADWIKEHFTYNANLITASNGSIIPGASGSFVVFGDITAFSKGMISGNFQTGYFPMYWGGLTAACAAMVLAAPKENRKQVSTFLVGVAIVAALTGIDEPIVFAFIFVGPILWAYNAVFTAIFAAIGVAMHMHIGFGFSGGFIDYVISFASSWGMSKYEGFANGPIYGVLSNPLWMIVLAIAIAPCYFFSFYFTIKKMDIQTPGREKDGSTNVPSTSSKTEKPDKKAKKQAKSERYQIMGQKFVDIIGTDNIEIVENCSARLRLTVKDNKVGTDAEFKEAGAKGVRRLGEYGLQLIIGTDVEHVADVVKEITGK